MLRYLIGKICHVYLDDIIIWSQMMAEHEQNICLVLQALQEVHLFCSPKKTLLFCNEINFLGHHILACGIEPDPKKVQRILDWPTPKSLVDIHSFGGLIRYLADHLPQLAKFTMHLSPLMTKEAKKSFLSWTTEHQATFNGIKALVTSLECLTTIDYDNPGENLIFLTCDASDHRSGTVLSWEKDVKSS